MDTAFYLNHLSSFRGTLYFAEVIPLLEDSCEPCPMGLKFLLVKVLSFAVLVLEHFNCLVAQLHFEVRKGATPVDPAQYLTGG